MWDIQHRSSETGHSTQKPIECMRRPIQNNSKPGEFVYEPFSGSGTTIIACEMMNRYCRAIEISPAYVDVGVRRWQDFSKQSATLDGDGRTFDEIAKARAGRKHGTAKHAQVRAAPRRNGLRDDGVGAAPKPGGNAAWAMEPSHERPGTVRVRKGAARPGPKAHRKPVRAKEAKGGTTEPSKA